MGKGCLFVRVCVFSFTDKGDLLNKKISALLDDCTVTSFFRGDNKNCLKERTAYAFQSCDALIFVGAAGIAVRACAPFLVSKVRDPAVVVCDELGQYCIPLLSGHIGGANRLAVHLSDMLGARAVITTATDINNVWAVDVWASERGFAIHNPQNIKYISQALLSNQRVGIVSDIVLNDTFPKNVVTDTGDIVCGIVVSPFLSQPYRHTLNIVPRCITLGAGSKKNADENALINAAEKILEENNISCKGIKNIATIDIKKNEPSVMALCRYFNVPLLCYSADSLNAVKGDFTPSDFVLSVTGTDNVCERSALAGGGKLIVKKTVGSGVTIAAAMCTEV